MRMTRIERINFSWITVLRYKNIRIRLIRPIRVLKMICVICVPIVTDNLSLTLTL